MQNSLVSIIIVNYCGLPLLKDCLQSLAKTNYPNYEIIIVDNNSNDGSKQFLKQTYPKIQLIELNKNYGFAVPNNIAAKVTRGKYLVFLNNDTTVTFNWLDELVYALEDDKTVVMGQSLIMNLDGSVDSSGDFMNGQGFAYSKRDIPSKMRYILSPRAACMIVRKDVFLDLGGFDESYFASFEDVQLGWKAWLWGYKIKLIPTSIVYHKGGMTVQKISKTLAFHGVKNNLLLILTNFDISDSIRILVTLPFIILVKKIFGLSLLKNQDQRFTAPDLKTIIRAGFWIIKNSRMIKTKRKEVRSRKVKTNAELKELGLIT